MARIPARCAISMSSGASPTYTQTFGEKWSRSSAMRSGQDEACGAAHPHCTLLCETLPPHVVRAVAAALARGFRLDEAADCGRTFLSSYKPELQRGALACVAR